MQPLAEGAGWLFGWLLRNSAHAAFLGIVLCFLELTVLRRLAPRWRYLLWLMVLARLLLPIAPESRLSLFNLVDLAPPGLAAFVGQILGLPAPVVLPSPEPPNPLTDTPTWFVWALAFWAPGALVLAFLVGRDHFRLRAALDVTAPTSDPDTLALVLQSRAVMKVRRPVEVVETPSISSPAITGWWRARVLLPAGLLPRLTRDEARYLFLHELAHVKRADLLLNWLLAVVQILHWFNPVIWLVIRRLLAVREEVCDDLVLRRSFPGANREYGLTLLRILEECAPRRIVPALAGVLDDLSSLRQRMRCIRNFDAPVGNPWAPAFLTVVIAVMGLTERQVDPDRLHTAPLVSPTSRSVRNGSRPGLVPSLPRRLTKGTAPRSLARSEAGSEAGSDSTAASRERRTEVTTRFLAALTAALADWTGSASARPSAPPSTVKRTPGLAQGAAPPGSNPVRYYGVSAAPSRSAAPASAARQIAAQPIPVVQVGHPPADDDPDEPIRVPDQP